LTHEKEHSEEKINSVKAWSLVSVPMQKSIDPEERDKQAKNTGAMPMPFEITLLGRRSGTIFQVENARGLGKFEVARCQKETSVRSTTA